jgi:hypothetical protein
MMRVGTLAAQHWLDEDQVGIIAEANTVDNQERKTAL